MVPPEIAVSLNSNVKLVRKADKLLSVPWFPMNPGPQCKKVVSVNVGLTALLGSEDPTLQMISTKLSCGYNGHSPICNHFLHDVCIWRTEFAMDV